MASVREARPQGLSLALGGGAVRGVAHLGVLDVLVEEGLPIVAVSGTSVGALVAAVFATRQPWPGSKALAEQINSCSLNPITQLQLPPKGGSPAARLRRWLAVARAAFQGGFGEAVFSGRGLEDFIRDLLGDLDFQDSHLPLMMAATDIDSGDCVILRDGPLYKAVRASSAIPGIFPPVPWRGRRLVDGASARLIPVEVLRPYASLVIGVDVSDASISLHPRKAYTIAWQASHISIRHLRNYALHQADAVICANSLKPVLGFDFTRMTELIDIGRRAAHQALPTIRTLLRESATGHPG